jgi:hypothetical protein
VRNGIIWLQTLIRAQCRDGSFGTETRCPRHEGNWFSARELVKKDNVAIVKAFQKRLQTVAGFEFIPDPLPMRNGNNAVVYYLFFASQKPVAKRIILRRFALRKNGVGAYKVVTDLPIGA